MSCVRRYRQKTRAREEDDPRKSTVLRVTNRKFLLNWNTWAAGGLAVRTRELRKNLET